MVETKPQQPMEFRPRPDQIRDQIHKLAADTKNIAWSGHALERMTERDIYDHVVIEVLRTGSPRGPIEPGSNPGEWKVKMVKEVKGRREAGVVVLTLSNARLLVKTAEWEDPQ